MRLLSTPKLKSLVFLILTLLSVGAYAQANYLDGPIQLQMRLRECKVNFNATDEGVFGVGFKPDELRFKFTATDTAAISGPAQYTQVNHNFNPPGLTPDFNTILFNFTYPSQVVPKWMNLRLEAWEDDSPDGVGGLGGLFQCGGNDFAYEPSFCCDFACLLNEGDDKHCDARIANKLDYRLGDPCEWYNHGFKTGTCTDYEARLETYWRYTKGTACNNAIDLGTFCTGTGGSAILPHYNSNKCYTNNYPGSPGNDVFYSFSICTPMGINANLCGPNGAQFNSVLYLLDQSCTMMENNNDGCGTQSNISTFLCQPGTYYLVVDATAAAEQGTFTLFLSEDTNFTFEIALAKKDVQCFGANDGTIKATVTGGNPPYTYLWSNGNPTDSIGGLGPGTYTFSATDSRGCVISKTTTIIEPAVLTALLTTTPVSCSGYEDGTATATPLGGTPPFQYFWNGMPPQVTQTAVVLPTGMITVNVIDFNRCIYTDSVFVGTSTVLLLTQDNLTNVTCNGVADGTINISMAGGRSPYTYNWSHGPATDDVTGLAPGSYTVIAYDADSCNISATFNITEPPLLTVVIDDTANARCNGGRDGIITVLTAGGTPSYSYAWSNGFTTQNALNVPAGNYTVTVTDQNLCTATTSHTLTEPAALVASFTPVNPACFGDSTGSIDLEVLGGTLPYNYLWTTNDTIQDINLLPAGTYGVLVTDSNNCFLFDFVSLSTNAPVDVHLASVTDVNCNGGNTGAINLTVTGGAAGPYTFGWSNAAASGQNPTNLPAGTYSVTVADQNGCTDTLSAVVHQPAALIATLVNAEDVNCNGNADGSIDITVTGGNQNYTYAWNDGAVSEDRINVPAGTYSVVVRDATACMATLNGLVVSEPPLLVTSIPAPIHPSCYGVSDGSVGVIALGGVFPYRYQWSNGATSPGLSNVGGGTYSVLVIDASGCVAFDTVTLTPATLLTLSSDVTDVLCNGGASGSITLTVTGGSTPYNYIWSPSVGNTATVGGLSGGMYHVTVADNNGCQILDSLEVEEPFALTVTVIAADVKCFGDADGVATPVVNGGTPTYTYAWSNSQTTAVATDLDPGPVTVTITDGNGCQKTGTGNVGGATLLTVAIDSVFPVTCFGESDGRIYLTAFGGQAPYLYSVLNNVSQGTGDFTGLEAGNYTAVVVDDNNCRATNDAVITEPADWEVTFAEPYVFVSRGADVLLEPVISDSVIVDFYSWSPGESLDCTDCLNPNASPLETETYTLTVTDIYGCTREGQVAVVVKNGFEVFYPNVFTPNGDIHNAIWSPIDFGSAATITIQIFDRWGSKVFESNDIRNGWDGTYKGNVVAPDTYVYVVNGTYLNGFPFNKTGSLSVIY